MLKNLCSYKLVLFSQTNSFAQMIIPQKILLKKTASIEDGRNRYFQSSGAMLPLFLYLHNSMCHTFTPSSKLFVFFSTNTAYLHLRHQQLGSKWLHFEISGLLMQLGHVTLLYTWHAWSVRCALSTPSANTTLISYLLGFNYPATQVCIMMAWKSPCHLNKPLFLQLSVLIGTDSLCKW